MIHEKGAVQIIDFGVAGMLQHKGDKRMTVIGTPHWMSPEILEGMGNEDRKKGYGTEVSETAWIASSKLYLESS